MFRYFSAKSFFLFYRNLYKKDDFAGKTFKLVIKQFFAALIIF